MARPKSNYPKDSSLFIRVDPELKERLHREARIMGLSLSAWVRLALIKASGYKSK